MTDWTDIADETVEPGKPIRSIDGLALRDNPIAITEGAAGAPRIQNAAMGADSVDNANVVNGTLGAEKFQTGTTERDWVLARTSDAAVGALGTYAFCRNTSASTKVRGDTIAGSDLIYADASGGSSFVPSGTWRCMGYAPDATNEEQTTLWLRIS